MKNISRIDFIFPLNFEFQSRLLSEPLWKTKFDKQLDEFQTKTNRSKVNFKQKRTFSWNKN